MKVVRNLLVVFGIIIITYGVMININRNKYTDMCTTVYVVKDEDQDHILDNGDFMVVRNNNENIRVIRAIPVFAPTELRRGHTLRATP